jgi:hypothetical protein
MRDVLELAGLLIIPAATALVVVLAIRKLAPSSGARFQWGLAIAIGFLAGSLIFPDRLPLRPERHWHWLPYVGLVAAIIGGMSANLGTAPRLLLYALLGGIAAWPLVPNYADLKPAKLVLVPLLAGYLAAIAGLLSLLPERLRGRPLIGLMRLAALSTSVMVISEISARIGLLSLRIPAAMLCCALPAWLLKPGAKGDAEIAVLGLIPVYVVLVGGSAFVGAIELPSPKWLLLLGPATPLLLWFFAWGPLSQLKGKAASSVQIILVVLIPIVLLVWWNWSREPAEEWSYVIESFHDSKSFTE